MARFMTPDEVADSLRVERRTLYTWRARGEGPPATRLGKYLRYDAAAFEQWVADRQTSAA